MNRDIIRKREPIDFTSIIIAIIIVVGVLGIFYFISNEQSHAIENQALKLDTCIKFANELGLDPNDSDKAEFIKGCFNN